MGSWVARMASGNKAVEVWLQRAFGRLARKSDGQERQIICSAAVLLVLSLVAMLGMQVELRMEEVVVPTGAPAVAHKDFIAASFGIDATACSVIATARHPVSASVDSYEEAYGYLESGGSSGGDGDAHGGADSDAPLLWENVVTGDNLAELQAFEDDVRALNVTLHDGSVIGYNDVCARLYDGAPCLVVSVLDYWAHDPHLLAADAAAGMLATRLVATSSAQPRAAALMNGASVTAQALTALPPVQRSSVLGGMRGAEAPQYDNTPRAGFEGASALKTTFMVRGVQRHHGAFTLYDAIVHGIPPETPEAQWEAAFMELAQAYTSSVGGTLRLTAMAKRSEQDGYLATTVGSLDLVVGCVGVMVAYVSVVFHRQPDTGAFSWRRIGLGLAGVVNVVCSVVIGVAATVVALQPVTMSSLFTFFLALGIGMDGVFVIVDVFDSAPQGTTLTERLSHTMRHAGPSVTIASVTDVLAFAAASMTPFPLIRLFCISTMVVLIFNYCLLWTFFAAVLRLVAAAELRDAGGAYGTNAAGDLHVAAARRDAFDLDNLDSDARAAREAAKAKARAGATAALAGLSDPTDVVAAAAKFHDKANGAHIGHGRGRGRGRGAGRGGAPTRGPPTAFGATRSTADATEGTVIAEPGSLTGPAPAILRTDGGKGSRIDVADGGSGNSAKHKHTVGTTGQRKAPAADAPGDSNAVDVDASDISHLSVVQRFLVRHYIPQLAKTRGKVLALLVTAALCGYSSYVVATRLTHSYGPTDILRDDSPFLEYLREADTYFNSTAVPAQWVVRDVRPLADMPVLQDTAAALQASPISYPVSDAPFVWWYQAWVALCVDAGDPEAQALHEAGVLAMQPRATDAVYDSFLSTHCGAALAANTQGANGADDDAERAAIVSVRHFVALFPWFGGDVSFATGSAASIPASRAMFSLAPHHTSGTQRSALHEVLRVAEGSGLGGRSFVFAPQFVLYSMYDVLEAEVATNLGAALALAVVVLAAFVHPGAVLLVLLIVTVVDIDLAAAIPILGYALNPITLATLAVSVGLSLDYAAHTCHAFMTGTGTRDERMAEAIVKVGKAVLNGGLTTALGLVTLWFAPARGFRMFTELFLYMVLLAEVHGLLVLPVLLSWFGPRPIFVVDDVRTWRHSQMDPSPARGASRGRYSHGGDSYIDMPGVGTGLGGPRPLRKASAVMASLRQLQAAAAAAGVTTNATWGQHRAVPTAEGRTGANAHTQAQAHADKRNTAGVAEDERVSLTASYASQSEVDGADHCGDDTGAAEHTFTVAVAAEQQTRTELAAESN